MDTNLELELTKKYPKILKDYRGDMMATCMAWGIECGNGWFNLLDKMLEKLQYFCDLCSKESGNEVSVTANQIKEKYGTLRFYYTVNCDLEIQDSIISDIVSEAEGASSRTCEVSGKDGNLCIKHGWYRTLSYEEARAEGYVACNPDIEKFWQSKDSNKKSI